ncbi:MAG: acyl-CoA dehydratase activase, partial [Pseudomonadota bacterium]
MIVAGIDCGAKNTKTVIMKDGRIIGKGLAPTGFDQAGAVKESFDAALKDAGVKAGDIEKTAGTGAGMDEIRNTDLKVNEVTAMARAANFFFPSARTVTDVGAEKGGAVRIDGKGNVLDFAVNEKCAAGAGAFIEAMARALEVELEALGPMAMESGKSIAMNAQCAIFAESEVVGLIHARTSKADISKAIHDAMASRIAPMIRRIGVNRDIVMIGGVGRNPGFVHSLKAELEIDEVLIPEDPAFGAAVGAAVVAGEGRAPKYSAPQVRDQPCSEAADVEPDRERA